jgi:type I restriction enzyme M protein
MSVRRWDIGEGLENWVRKRYIVLLDELGDEKFTAEKAEAILRSRGLEIENINKLISVLRKKGLLRAEPDPNDARKAIYSFIFPSKLESAGTPGKDEILRLLKKCADLIRTAVDYKVLLLFLFYKAVSDKWEKIKENYEKEGHSEEEAFLLTNSEYIRLYDENEKKLYTWNEVMKTENIGEIGNAIKKISNMNENLDRLEKLAEVLGFFGFISDENRHIIGRIIQEFNSYDFSDVSYDVLGDAYQWILSYFAPEKAKEGETYTPREVIKLLVNLLDVEDGSKVLDPACGSAAMLIEAYNHVKEKNGGKEVSVELVGQERSEIMAIIARMNAILHGVENCRIEIGDSLLNPKFDEADYVIANPPWNQDGYDEEDLGTCKIKQAYNTFVSGGYPPKSSADWAWIQLMLYHARKKVGIVLDQGALFREGKEAEIRKGFVEKDLIEAVILLPEKLFYNTSASGIIMILNRSKPEDRRGKILFINASNEYEKHPEIKKLNRLSDENIKRIVDAYRKFADIEGFSKVVDISEIAAKEYSLNVTLYVIPNEKKEEIDILKEFQELKELEKERQDAMMRIEQYVMEIARVG